MASDGKPSKAELKAAARKRLPGTSTPVTDLFSNRGYTYGTYRYSLPTIRVTDEMANRVADWGNKNGVSISDAVRELIKLGLESEDNHD